MTKLTKKEYYELDSLLTALLADEGGFDHEEITEVSFYLLKALSEQNIVDVEEIFDDKEILKHHDTLAERKIDEIKDKRDRSFDHFRGFVEFDPEIHL